MSIIENALGKLKVESPSVAPIERNQPLPQAQTRSVDLATRLASRPMLELEFSKLRQLGILPPLEDERRMMAEYRAIKRRLLAPLSQRSATPLPRGNVIMVASAVPAEGKTFTSFNLAMSLSTEQDWTIVLLDADSARQHLTNSLGMARQPGLLDVLRDPTQSLVDVMHRTSVPNLNFVPAGSSSENATELMASARMAGVVQELLRSNPRTILLFDSSPVLPTPESRALADAVGQIVLVVKAESTPRSDVEDAIKILGEGHKIGVVLNQFQGSSQAEYYGTYGSSAADAGAIP